MATYVRQSSFSDGDTITAALFNNEFNQLVNAFNVATGHTHDGSTAGDGGPISNLFSNALVFGTNTDNDVVITFNANSNDGVLTWMEDEDYFQFSDDLLLTTTEKLQFRDTAIYINSSTDGQLDIVADTEIQIAATTIDMNGNADISGNLGVGGNLTVTGTTTFNGGTITMGDAATDNVVFGADVDSNIIPDDDDSYDLGSSTQEWRNLYIDGTANIDSLVADTADINGGTIDAANITVGSGKTLDVSAGSLTLADNQISGDKVEGGTINATTINTLTYGSITDGTITVTAFVDEDNMASNSATLIPTQQSVKAYVDAQDTAQDLDLVSDSGTIAIDLDGETLTVTGGEGIDTSASSNTLTITGEDATTSNKGIASFNSDDFNVSSGAVTLATTSTAAELNLLDGTTAGTIVASKGVAVDANKDITGFRNITLTGELDAGSLDVSGNVDVDGTLETDALSINGTTVTSTAAELNILDGKAFLDEDDMSSNSATGIASQQSIKAYVDTQITAEDLDITTDSGTIAIDLDSETLTVSGGTGLDSSATGNAVTLAIDSTVATLTGSQTLTNKSLTAPTLTGTTVVASLDISGDIDVDGTTNLDVVDIDGAVDMASTLGVTGVVTANAGVVVDNITIDGSEIDCSSGNLVLDGASNITLDADGGQFELKDGGALVGQFDFTSGSNFEIQNRRADGDITFRGFDDSSFITALTLDMSNAGAATFNAGATFAGNVDVTGILTLSDTTNDDANKTFTLLSRQYDSGTETEGFLMMQSFANSSGNRIDIGGGTSQHNASTVINFHTAANTTTRTGTERLTLKNSEMVVNDASNDYDFRVESNNNANMLFVDGGNNRVGIGTGSPLSAFNVKGTQGNWRVDPDSVSNEIQILSTTVANDGFRNLRLRSNDIILEAGGAERLNILSGGNITIKTVDAFLYSPASSGGTTIDAGLKFESSNQRLEFWTADVERMSIASNGAATFTGAITANAGVVVDNITIDGNEIDVGSGDLTLDVAGDIIFDADGGVVYLNDGGVGFGQLVKNSNDFRIFNPISDGDIVFRGNDGGSVISALTLDMSAAGTATFNNDINSNGNININGDYLNLTNAFRIRSVSGQTGQIGFNRDPAGGANLGESSLARFQINGPFSGSNFLDFQAYHSNGNYQGGMRLDAGGLVTVPTAGAHAVFNENGVDADFRVESSGNANMLFVDGGSDHVNIGTATDLGSALNVSGDITVINATTGPTIEISSNGGGVTSSLIMHESSVSGSPEYGASVAYDGATNLFKIGVGQDVTTERMRIERDSGNVTFNESGNDSDFRVESNDTTHMLFVDGGNSRVGIGIEPAAHLHVRKNTGLNETAELLRLDCGDTTHVGGKGGKIKFTDISVYNSTAEIIARREGVSGGSHLEFSLRDTVRLGLYSTGNLQTYPAAGGHAVFNQDGNDVDFRVESNVNANTIFMEGSSGVVNFGRGSSSINTNGAYILGGEFIASMPASTNTYLLRNTATTAYTFYVSSAGQIHAVQTSISSLSDERLKENIKDIDTGLSEVMALKPRKFDWKEGEGSNEKNVTGFVAQEVETVLPNLIGNFEHDDLPDAKSVKMGDMVPTLVKAIQEQQTLIEKLTARITELENS